MADNQTEKQKVQELTDKLERGLTEFFNRTIPAKYEDEIFALLHRIHVSDMQGNEIGIIKQNFILLLGLVIAIDAANCSQNN